MSVAQHPSPSNLLRQLAPSSEIPAPVEVPQFLRAAGLELDRYAHTVRFCGRATPARDLSRVEFKLLEVLMSNSPRAVAADVLYKEVWNLDFIPSTNRLAVYVRYLREELGEDLIETVRGFGYRIVPERA